jgi:hypothetical protein
MDKCANCGQNKVKPEDFTVSYVARLRGKKPKKVGKLCHDCATLPTEKLAEVMD